MTGPPGRGGTCGGPARARARLPDKQNGAAARPGARRPAGPLSGGPSGRYGVGGGMFYLVGDDGAEAVAGVEGVDGSVGPLDASHAVRDVRVDGELLGEDAVDEVRNVVPGLEAAEGRAYDTRPYNFLKEIDAPDAGGLCLSTSARSRAGRAASRARARRRRRR